MVGYKRTIPLVFMLCAVLFTLDVVCLSCTAAPMSENNEEGISSKGSSSLWDNLEGSPLFWVATVVVFAIGIMLCAGGEDTVNSGPQPESFPYRSDSGQVAMNSAYNYGESNNIPQHRPQIPQPNVPNGNFSRPAIATPQEARPKRPEPPGHFMSNVPAQVLENYFVKLNGEYRQVSQEDAENFIAQGKQVFTQPDRSQAGVDIYEALPTSHDLYSVVSRKAPDNLYSTPAKVRKSQPPKQQQMNVPVPQIRPSHSVPDDYEDPDTVAAVIAKTNQYPPPQPPRSTIPDDYDHPDTVPTFNPPPPLTKKPYANQSVVNDQSINYFGSADVVEWVNKSGITRHESERLLQRHRIGTFLIRKRDSGSYALAMCGESKICHYKIEVDAQEKVFIDHGKDSHPTKFSSIRELIQFYMNHNYKLKGGLGANLTGCLPFSA
eukprot:m.89016 g.89016  ORF g.89016 m.89016 type:complete len:435 (-) comp8822_c5_seq1:471-1775(-)